jgi:hypothetical protein
MPTNPRPSLWAPLEAIPDLAAVAFLWRRHYGPLFDPLLQAGILTLTPQYAEEHPCTQAVPCPCFHRADPGNGSRKARCTCEPSDCPPFTVDDDQLRLIRLSLPKLATMVAKALGLKGAPRPVPGFPGAYDLGAWYPEPGSAYRILASFSPDEETATSTAHALSARAKAPFGFLVTATSCLTEAALHSVAAARGVAHALSEITRLTPAGHLESTVRPADLFAPLHAKPIIQKLTLTDVEKLFDLADKLNVRVRRGPTGRQFMDLYCREGMALRTIERRRPGWNYSTIRNIRDRLTRNGIDLDAVRAYFQRDVETEIADAGLAAPGVYRKGLAEE